MPKYKQVKHKIHQLKLNNSEVQTYYNAMKSMNISMSMKFLFTE